MGIPILKLSLRAPSWGCARHAALALVGILLSPLFCLSFAARNPKRVFAPNEIVIHVVFPILVTVLCLWPRSAIPGAVACVVHMCILLGLAVDGKFYKRLRWRAHRKWWLLLQLA